MTTPRRKHGNDAASLMAHPQSPIERLPDAKDHPVLFELPPVVNAEAEKAPEDES